MFIVGDRISATGRRVAHGGNRYMENTLVTPEILKEIQVNSQFAPVHNHLNVLDIRACMDALGADISQVGVFAF